MTALEYACWFATWCSAARFKTAARRWLDDAFAFAHATGYAAPVVSRRGSRCHARRDQAGCTRSRVARS